MDREEQTREVTNEKEDTEMCGGVGMEEGESGTGVEWVLSKYIVGYLKNANKNGWT